MNGAEVADQLLHTDKTRDIPSHSSPGSFKRKSEQTEGIYTRLSIHYKPITKDELVQQVDAVFEIIKTEKRFIRVVRVSA